MSKKDRKIKRLKYLCKSWKNAHDIRVIERRELEGRLSDSLHDRRDLAQQLEAAIAKRDEWRANHDRLADLLKRTGEHAADITEQRDEALQECARLADVVMTLRFRLEAVRMAAEQPGEDEAKLMGQLSRSLVNGGVYVSKDGPQ